LTLHTKTAQTSDEAHGIATKTEDLHGFATDQTICHTEKFSLAKALWYAPMHLSEHHDPEHMTPPVHLQEMMDYSV